MSIKVKYVALSTWIISHKTRCPSSLSDPHTARVALVKCRDLHWAMMAHRDQRDTSLSSLRMLIVADGANPCEYARNTSSVNLNFKKHQYVEFFLSSRVCVFLRCLPERVSVPWTEGRGGVSLCHLSWGHDSGHSQVSDQHKRYMIKKYCP